IGSFIVTADAISAANLKLETIVDGHVMQHGTTADMVFSVPQLVAFTSRHVTLRPGDVILTGTPDGVGIGRNPRIYMKPGALLTTWIEGNRQHHQQNRRKHASQVGNNREEQNGRR